MASVALMVRRAGLLLLVAVFAAWLVCGAVSLRAAEPASQAVVPPGLDLVPRDATAFVHVRIADAAASPVFAEVRRLVGHAGAEAWQTFEKQCPLPPTLIESVTLVMLTPQTLTSPFPSADPEAVSALVFVTTKAPYDRLRVMQSLGHREKLYRRQWYYFDEDLWSGLLLLDERTFAVGSEDAICQFVDRMLKPSADKPLQAALAQGARHPHVLVGFNAKALAKEQPFQMFPPPVRPLLAAECATLSVRFDTAVEIEARFHYFQEAQAQAGETAVRAAAELIQQGLGMPIQEIEKQLRGVGDSGPGELPEKFFYLIGLGIFRELQSLVKAAPIQRSGSTVQISLSYRTTTPFQMGLVSSFGMITMLGSNAARTFNTVAQTIGAPAKSPEEAHLKQLATALERYHSTKGTYPPPALYDANGRPLLSWRVALLPYLNEQALYSEFKLNEAWDSRHNKRLIKRMPRALTLQTGYSWRRKPGTTRDLVFTGPNTIFESAQGIRKGQVAPKSALLVLVDSDRSVYWTKPADLVYEPGKPLPKLFGVPGRFAFNPVRQAHVMLVDGTLRTLAQGIDDKDLLSLIQRDPAAKLAPKADPKIGDLEAAWTAFTYSDDAGAALAFQHVGALLRTPEKTVAFLKERLRPAAAPDAKHTKEWIAALDGDAFAAREKAAQALESLGVGALPALRKKLDDGKLSLETRKRLDRLIQKLETQPIAAEELRSLRAIEVLRGIGTPQAHEVLAALAQGADGTLQTMAARDAVKGGRNRQ